MHGSTGQDAGSSMHGSTGSGSGSTGLQSGESGFFSQKSMGGSASAGRPGSAKWT